MVDLFLVRHGEAAATWREAPDPGLSDLGRAQAEQAARELAGREIASAAVVSSPLRRAVETAEPYSASSGRPVTIDRRVREIPATVPLAERQDWLRAFMHQRWEVQPAPLQSWRAGILAALGDAQEPTIFFTHFLVINTVLAAVYGRGETLHFWPDNGSVTQLRRSENRLELVALGRSMETSIT